MSIGLIVQARMSSSRLPAKSTLPISGVTLLQRVLNSCLSVRGIDRLILAIPDSNDCNILQEIGLENNVDVFRGPPDNVLKRYQMASNAYQINTIIRVTADDPCMCPRLIESGIDRFHATASNYFISSWAPRNLADGLIYEIFSRDLLDEVVCEYGEDAMTQEHVTYPLRHSLMRNVVQCFLPNDEIPQCHLDSGVKLCVDTHDDYCTICEAWSEYLDPYSKLPLADIPRILSKIAMSKDANPYNG